METNKLIAGIVAAAIAIIVLAGVLMPALSNATTTHETFTNEGLWRMSAFDDEQEWEYSDGTWTLNSEEQISGTTVTSNTGSSAVLGNNFTIRANGWIRGNTITGNATNPITIVSGDTVTVQDGGTSVTVDKSGFGVDVKGDYLMTSYTIPVYVKGDTPIYATGQSSVGTGRGIIHLEGTIDDGITASAMAIKNDPYTDFSITNVQINYEEVDGYKDLYKLTSITADVSCVDGDSNTLSGSVTYSSYVVPYKVTAEKAVHLDPAMNGILNVIPLLIIVAVLLGVVAVFILRRE